MKKRVVLAVIFIVIVVAWWFVVSSKKEKYETSSNCAPGYIQSCISMSIPGGGPVEKTSSNTCPESYFVMCLPDVQYQLTPESVCPRCTVFTQSLVNVHLYRLLKSLTLGRIMLLSIDVGLKNLAMCLMDSSTKKIHKWDVSSVPTQHADGLFRALRTHLCDRSWTLDAETILIEKQPDKNRTMKSVENFLHVYFLCHDRNVIVWDARHKVPDVAGPGRARYIQRKKASIERCRQFLTETQPEWVPIFDKHKKKMTSQIHACRLLVLLIKIQFQFQWPS